MNTHPGLEITNVQRPVRMVKQFSSQAVSLSHCRKHIVKLTMSGGKKERCEGEFKGCCEAKELRVVMSWLTEGLNHGDPACLRKKKQAHWD